MAVAMVSTVSVFVIDCTRTGASPPIVTMREPQTASAWRECLLSGAATATGNSSSCIFKASPQTGQRYLWKLEQDPASSRESRHPSLQHCQRPRIKGAFQAPQPTHQ